MIDNGDRSNHCERLWVRHAQVDARYRGVCYGRSDVPLSAEGREQSLEIAQRLSQLPIKAVVHSGLQRTAFLAETLAQFVGLTAQADEAIAERDFGDWELQSWDDIYRQHGEAMMRMVTEPDAFRPGGGETTAELAQRVWDWCDKPLVTGLVVVVSHGGPIAAHLGRQRNLPVADWPALVPACGTVVPSDRTLVLQGSLE